MRPEATASAVDLYLACACTLGIPEALDAFVRVYLAPIEQALGSLRRSVDPDEVRQLLAIHLVLGDADRPAKIREYRGRGALAGWVRIAAVRTALDLARRTSRERSDDDAFDDAVADLAVDGELELELVRNRYAEHFRGGFREALQRTAAPDRALLRLH